MTTMTVPHWITTVSLRNSLFAALTAMAVMAAPGVDAKPAQGHKPAAKSSAKATRLAKLNRQRVVLPRAKVQRVVARVAPDPVSMGQAAGLHTTRDPLALKSSVALVLDQDTNQVLLSKNADAVLPIASITKLMTAMVVIESGMPMEEPITVTQGDVDTEKGSGSRLVVGTQLTRGEMLHLALMSSENRAAHALGRHYPGGLENFVQAMNSKAQTLGMAGTRYVEPTGLSSENRSTATDLAVLVRAAYEKPLIRELSTSREAQVAVGSRQVQFHNTNRLVSSPTWDIGLQKTGYISEAGRCLVMQAQMAGRKVIMVFLDSAGKYSRLGDAERIRKWLGEGAAAVSPARPLATH